MLDSIQSLLDVFPEGVVHIREGLVLSANRMAAHYLPQLRRGVPLPSCIPLSDAEKTGAGVFTAGPAAYTFSFTAAEDGCLLLFRPAPQTALTGRQLEGALQQLRALLGDVLAEAGTPGALSAAAFSKSFHRLFRLTGNLEHLQQAAGSAGVPFHPVTMDLAGLCLHISRQAGSLLREAGVTLEYTSRESGLLIPGDPELLQKLLLGLISNAARAAGEGHVSLTLSRQGSRAVLVVSDSGPALTERQLAALFQQGTGEELPLPGQGAGIGLAVARHIVTLHRGSMLVGLGDSSPRTALCLPTGPLSGRTPLRTPSVQRNGGLDPVLTELADILPASLFGLEGLD